MTAAIALAQASHPPFCQPSPAPRLSVISGGLISQSEPEAEIQLGVERLFPELRRRARYLTKGTDSALDLVQDTVERAMKFAHGYQPGTNLRAWLFQIMYSVFASQCRRAQRHRNVLERVAAEPDHWGASTDSEASYPGLSRVIEAQLASLPAAFAHVIWLVDVQQLSYKEAADQLGAPIGTIMSRLHRARRLLRARLEQAA